MVTTQTGPLTPYQVRRYSRHIIMPQVGSIGQRKLLDSRVLIVGAGGLGSPIAIYLTLAGIGTIGIVDFDTAPSLRWSRLVEMERTSSHLMKPGLPRPASGGSTRTWCGKPLSFVVSGRAITRPERPRFQRSWETMRDGRGPPCSWPRGWPKSAYQISPRRGVTPSIRRPPGHP